MKQSKCILLVEDDEDDQEFFISAIEDMDNVIVQAVVSNGKEALRHLANSTILPSVIFMDIDMPLMNGIECLAEIIRNPKTKAIPVVMLTTSTYQSERSQSLGAKAFIMKPDNVNTLRQQLEDILHLNFTGGTGLDPLPFQLNF
jgi:CheY-like chemotaxis protein